MKRKPFFSVLSVCCQCIKKKHVTAILGITPSSFLIILLSCSCFILKLHLLMIMLQPSSPKHNDKPDTEEWIDKFGKLFQSLDSIFIFLLQSFIFVKFLKCLLLFLLIDINKLSPSETHDHVLKKTSQELRMLSRSLSDCKSLLLNVLIKFRNFSVIVNCVTQSLIH